MSTAVDNRLIGTAITGSVAAVNPKGLRVSGHDGWLNYSRWADPITPPGIGDQVVITLDRQGYVRSLPPAPASVIPAVTPATPPAFASAQPASTAPPKDVVITRLAVLKAAAAFMAARPDGKSGDVLRIATAWETWVLRDGDTRE